MSERELFLAALQIADPHERSAYLDRAFRFAMPAQ